MFDFVRRNTRILQLILVLLILPSFVLVGMEGYSQFTDNAGTVAKVGKQKVPSRSGTTRTATSWSANVPSGPIST